LRVMSTWALVFFLAAASVAAVTPAFAAGAATTSTATAEPMRFTVSDGAVEIAVPAGWESNPRLAKDNDVVGFLNPTGLKLDAQVPIWLIVDQRVRDDGQSFDAQMRAILAEGKGFGYTPKDSTSIRTADGGAIRSFSFRTSTEGLHCGLGFLESPKGTILLRYQSLSEAIWKEQGDQVRTMLRSVKFIKS